MDGRILDIPYWRRELLVKWLIVPFRYKKSARAYAKIWTEAGSPLMMHSKMLVKALSEELQMKVAIGLSYANPSIEQALNQLRDCTKIIVVPLFPQYASATSGSCLQEVMRALSTWQVIPEITFRGPFANHDRFIDAWVANCQNIDIQSYDHVLFSFHGLPIKQVKKQDRERNGSKSCCFKSNCCLTLNHENAYCYAAECVYTAKKIAERLNIENYTLCYQSRLGVEKWLGPYTIDTIKARRKLGDKKLLVFAPSFVADCLETLYEISMEYKEEFLLMGGTTLDLVPSLNASPAWVSALKDIINNDKAGH